MTVYRVEFNTKSRGIWEPLNTKNLYSRIETAQQVADIRKQSRPDNEYRVKAIEVNTK